MSGSGQGGDGSGPDGKSGPGATGSPAEPTRGALPGPLVKPPAGELWDALLDDPAALPGPTDAAAPIADPPLAPGKDATAVVPRPTWRPVRRFPTPPLGVRPIRATPVPGAEGVAAAPGAPPAAAPPSPSSIVPRPPAQTRVSLGVGGLPPLPGRLGTRGAPPLPAPPRPPIRPASPDSLRPALPVAAGAARAASVATDATDAAPVSERADARAPTLAASTAASGASLPGAADAPRPLSSTLFGVPLPPVPAPVGERAAPRATPAPVRVTPPHLVAAPPPRPPGAGQALAETGAPAVAPPPAGEGEAPARAGWPFGTPRAAGTGPTPRPLPLPTLGAWTSGPSSGASPASPPPSGGSTAAPPAAEGEAAAPPAPVKWAGTASSLDSDGAVLATAAQDGGGTLSTAGSAAAVGAPSASAARPLSDWTPSGTTLPEFAAPLPLPLGDDSAPFVVRPSQAPSGLTPPSGRANPTGPASEAPSLPPAPPGPGVMAAAGSAPASLPPDITQPGRLPLPADVTRPGYVLPSDVTRPGLQLPSDVTRPAIVLPSLETQPRLVPVPPARRAPPAPGRDEPFQPSVTVGPGGAVEWEQPRVTLGGGDPEAPRAGEERLRRTPPLGSPLVRSTPVPVGAPASPVAAGTALGGEGLPPRPWSTPARGSPPYTGAAGEGDRFDLIARLQPAGPSEEPAGDALEAAPAPAPGEVPQLVSDSGLYAMWIAIALALVVAAGFLIYAVLRQPF